MGSITSAATRCLAHRSESEPLRRGAGDAEIGLHLAGEQRPQRRFAHEPEHRVHRVQAQPGAGAAQQPLDEVRIPRRGRSERPRAEARNRNQSPNLLLVQLAMEALDHREWPRTELEIQLLRSTLFTAQATARNMIAEGREKEVEEIRREISKITPQPPRPTQTNER